MNCILVYTHISDFLVYLKGSKEVREMQTDENEVLDLSEILNVRSIRENLHPALDEQSYISIDNSLKYLFNESMIQGVGCTEDESQAYMQQMVNKYRRTQQVDICRELYDRMGE